MPRQLVYSCACWRWWVHGVCVSTYLALKKVVSFVGMNLRKRDGSTLATGPYGEVISRELWHSTQKVCTVDDRRLESFRIGWSVAGRGIFCAKTIYAEPQKAILAYKIKGLKMTYTFLNYNTMG